MKNWILSTHLSASAAFIKASEDTAGLVSAAALKIHSDDFTFKVFYFLRQYFCDSWGFLRYYILFRFDKLAREVWGYQGIVQTS